MTPPNLIAFTSPSTEVEACFPLPLEIVERILSQCRVQDAVAFGQTCRLACALLWDSSCQNSLWRDIFLTNFDDPCRVHMNTCHPGPNVDWKGKACQRMKAELAHSTNPDISISLALDAFISAFEEASIKAEGFFTRSLNVEWLEHVLPTSDILNVSAMDVPLSKRPLHARLRAYVGLSHDQGHNEESRLRLLEHRKNSRLYVYNVRNYSSRQWGPFLDNDQVDWVHLEHLVNVLVMNLRQLPSDWVHISPPLGLEATRAYSAPISSLDEPSDWAKVAGTWRRCVSYMDFRDLYSLNFDLDGELDLNFFDCPRFREATRLLEVKLHLVDKTSSRFRSHLWTDTSVESINSAYPPIYFAGTSNNYKGNRAVVEGMVHMTSSGIVRWRFTSTHPETARWCSDGVQIGHIASASGVVGVWTTEYHQKDDPIGPFWLWKVPDDYPVRLIDYSR